MCETFDQDCRLISRFQISDLIILQGILLAVERNTANDFLAHDLINSQGGLLAAEPYTAHDLMILQL